MSYSLAFRRTLASVKCIRLGIRNTHSEPNIHNSLTGQLEILPSTSSDQKYVSWYACGPTVYDDAHLGHARTYICFDIIRRILTQHYKVPLLYAMGVTDIDDKIINRANEEGISPIEVAKKYEERFFEDMSSLDVQEPHVRLRVSEHMQNIITYIETIIERGHAYSTDSGVYFDVCKFGDDNYGRFKHNFTDDREDENVDIKNKPDKRDRRDFALWKRVNQNQSQEEGLLNGSCWDSPWGYGRPGWHIECSALTHSHFGQNLDIHSGGRDLAFPHHCNEIAQCESHNNVPGEGWGSLWMHTGHLYIKGRKMSKSLKNFITVRDLLNSGVSSDDIRMFCLQHHYRADVHFSDDRMIEAQSVRSNLIRFAERAQSLGVSTGPWDKEDTALFSSVMTAEAGVKGALADDFDTPTVLRVLSTLVSSADVYLVSKEHGGIPKQPLEAASQLITSTLSLLGVSSIPQSSKSKVGSENVLNELIAFRSHVRETAKKSLSKSTSNEENPLVVGIEMLKMCDDLRDRVLPSLGVYVEDRVSGTFVSTVPPVKNTKKK